MGDITVLIQRARDGDRQALDQLFEALYPEMRRIAHLRLRRGFPDPDLGTTALVHECYLKLRDAQRLDASDRAHFLSYTATAMRSIIVDIARAMCALQVLIDVGEKAAVIQIARRAAKVFFQKRRIEALFDHVEAHLSTIEFDQSMCAPGGRHSRRHR